MNVLDICIGGFGLLYLFSMIIYSFIMIKDLDYYNRILDDADAIDDESPFKHKRVERAAILMVLNLLWPLDIKLKQRDR